MSPISTSRGARKAILHHKKGLPRPDLNNGRHGVLSATYLFEELAETGKGKG